MDAAPLDTLKIVVVPVHEMHSPDEKGIPVEFPQGIEILPDKGLSDELPDCLLYTSPSPRDS